MSGAPRSSLALPVVSLVSVNFTDLGVDFLELLVRFHWLWVGGWD